MLNYYKISFEHFLVEATETNREYISGVIQKFVSRAMGQDKLALVLKSCTRASELTQIHAHMIKVGYANLPFPLSKLLASSVSNMDYASAIFNKIETPNLFMFNTMLRGYSASNKPVHALQALPIFNALRAARGAEMFMDQFSFVSMLKSCARCGGNGEMVRVGIGVHGLVLVCGFELYINVRNSLLHFYCSCKRIRDAQKLFDEIPVRDLVSWNTLIGGYLQISQPEEVVRLFREMHGCGMEVSIVTVLRVLSAWGDLGNLFGGEAVHGHCVKRVFCLELNVVTAMIGMYARNGCMESARKIFDAMGKKDVVAWNCIIEGYAKNGLVEESLRLLEVMRSQNVKPNTATLVGLLSACASSGAMAAGLCIHKYIKDESLDLDVALGTALIDMYLKCGSVEKAVDVFDNMQSKDVKSWTALIAGYGLHGKGDDAIWLFNKMESEGVMPNEVTFLAVLNACSHNGLVTEGKNFLERMIQIYGFSPSVEHYGCIIDLLGRAGLLEEAYELIKSLSVESDSRTWRALLAACRLHGNVELGETVKTMLVELNDEHPTDSILLSGSYASLGRWDDIARMREQREEKLGNKKEAGWSSVQVNG